jgi:hypothetical protein
MARRKAFKLPNPLKPKKSRKKSPLQKLDKWMNQIEKKPYGPMGWW